MEKARYVVEYFPENSDVMETIFVEAESKLDARQKVADRFGAFVNIVACNLAKSEGGPGAQFQPDVPVQLADQMIADDVVDVKPKKVKAAKADKPVKEPKVPKLEKTSGTKKVNADLVAEKAAELKASGGTREDLKSWVAENVTSCVRMVVWHTNKNWK